MSDAICTIVDATRPAYRSYNSTNWCTDRSYTHHGITVMTLYIMSGSHRTLSDYYRQLHVATILRLIMFEYCLFSRVVYAIYMGIGRVSHKPQMDS